MALPVIGALTSLLRGEAFASRSLNTLFRWSRRLDGGGDAGSGVVFTARVSGLQELKRALQDLPNKIRKQVLRSALMASGRVVRDEARRNAPVLSQAEARRAPFRKPGTLRRAIMVRSSKMARKAGDVGVFVNVKPAGPGKRGAKSPDDPFYWRWVNFGFTRGGVSGSSVGLGGRRRGRGAKREAGVRFLERGASKLQDALQVFIAKAGPAIQKYDRPPK